MEQQQELANLLSRLQRINIPDDALRVNLEDYKAPLPQYETIVSKAKKVVEGFIRNETAVDILFHGTYGSGKTLLSSLMLKEVFLYLVKKYGFGPFAYRTHMAQIVEEFGNEGFTMPAKYKDTRILLVDELGREPEYRNGMALSIFEALIKFRSEKSHLYTWFVTNMDTASLVNRYGGCFGSLLKGNYLNLKFPHYDYRGLYLMQQKPTFDT